MRREGLPDIVINTFAHYYQQLTEGQTGLISEADIRPVESLPDAQQFPETLKAAGRAALPQTVYIKLNGGLGTSMGLEQAKSLLPVKDGLTFLDIIARHALATEVRLLLMNSFATQADSLAVLQNYPELNGNIPLDFLQHKVPKVAQADLKPVDWPQEPELEWCPPGHGDLYTALVTSGMLDTLLEAGYVYAFISNADNLGAIIDLAILGYFASEQIPFMMEVTDRTPADSKGGHLARQPDGQLILREIAQCPETDLTAFQDITRHKYFNTNNLWIHLPQLKATLEHNDYVLGLPMIRNAKTVDPRDKDSTPVYQLETAMGSAIAVFDGAQAIRVPRTRFAPVKKTNDLLALRSDVFCFDDPLLGVVPHPARATNLPLIDLDPAIYGLIADFEARFPQGVPSLLECENLTIKGDIKFGRNIKLKGSVQLINNTTAPQQIADNLVIEGD
ncbi:MAG: UTP--glucose-1-phosphate uridylyltransferase [Anaerolineae bacterium]|nr:UTP--glucose-1-phosphate uridylyltransferase [Anaerolineae bacterium]